MGIPVAPRAAVTATTGRSSNKRALRKGVQAAWRDLIVTTHEFRHTRLSRSRPVLLLLLAVLVIVLLLLSATYDTWSKKKTTAHEPHYRFQLLGKGRRRFGSSDSRKGRRRVEDDRHGWRTRDDDVGRRRCQLTVKDLIGPMYPFIARVARHRSSSSSSSSWAVHTLFRGPLVTARIPLDMTNINMTRITNNNHEERALSHHHRLRYSRRFVNDDEDDDKDLLVAAIVSLRVVQTNGTASLSSFSATMRDDQTITSFLNDGKQAVVCQWADIPSDTRDALTQLDPAPTSTVISQSRFSHNIHSSFTTTTSTLSGVSLVAACKDRSDMLRHVLPSWHALRGVNEMVVVDWGSHPAMLDDTANSPFLRAAAARADESITQAPSPRLVVVRVAGNDAHQWSLSRAYNLAIRLTAYDTVLKVDCDTSVHRDFLSKHTLPAMTDREDGSSRVFFAANNSVSDVQQQGNDPQMLHANGVLLARRVHLLEVGGYDERLETYGWDDSDIMSRLTQSHPVAARRTSRWSASSSSSSSNNIPRLQMLPINLAYVSHVPHPPSLRVAAQAGRTLLPVTHPLTAPVEIQRNRLLLTRSGLSPWTARSPSIPWQIVTRRSSSSPTTTELLLEAYNPSTKVPVAALDLLSDDARSDVDAHALRLVLRRFGASLGLSALALPRTLSVEFLRGMIDTLAYPSYLAHVSVSLHGGIMARVLALLSAIQLVGHDTTTSTTDFTTRSTTNKNTVSRPPVPFTRWHLSFRWTHDERLGTACRMSTLFEQRHVEICDDDNTFNFRRAKCPTFYHHLPDSTPLSSSPLSVAALHELAASNRVHSVLSRFNEHAHPVSIQTPWHSIVTTATTTNTNFLKQNPTATANSSSANSTTIHVVAVDSTCDPGSLVTSSVVRFWLQPPPFSSHSAAIVHEYLNSRRFHNNHHTSNTILDVDHRYINPTVVISPSTRDTLKLFDHHHTSSSLPAFAAAWAGAPADVYGNQATVLLARARMAFIAACRDEKTAEGRLRGGGMSDQLKRIVQGLNSLFAGCERNVCEFFVRTPELAVVSASLMIHEQCVRPGFAIGV